MFIRSPRHARARDRAAVAPTPGRIDARAGRCRWPEDPTHRRVIPADPPRHSFSTEIRHPNCPGSTSYGAACSRCCSKRARSKYWTVEVDRHPTPPAIPSWNLPPL